MLTQLRLKNWRSLRDVTIDDLQPINVFIGANSSGKSNILDALYFTREIITVNTLEAVYKRQGGAKIRTLGSAVDEPVEIEFTVYLPDNNNSLHVYPVTWVERITFSEQPYKFQSERTFAVNGQQMWTFSSSDNSVINEVAFLTYLQSAKLPVRGNKIDYAAGSISNFSQFVSSRWQMLDENFMPPLGQETSKRGSPIVIERCAENLVFMLNYMQETLPHVYHELQNDLRYLLTHISQMQTQQDDHEANFLIHEVSYPNTAAPTVSAGTARILAMLTAYYALDLRNPSLPGLVVIEEPDTALNPGLLKNFVEQLREYVDREEPRQFILTTHNPAFLNYFKPEEVRIVSRDDQGYTTVNRVPDYIKDIWLDEHGLGEVWLTNAFGGVPE